MEGNNLTHLKAGSGEEDPSLILEESDDMENQSFSDSVSNILMLNIPTSTLLKYTGFSPSFNFTTMSEQDKELLIEEISHMIKPKFTGALDFEMNTSPDIFKDQEFTRDLEQLTVSPKYGESPRRKKF
jgi:hypothetical protein